MATGPRDPPEKARALTVRVWLEESGDPRPRIRMAGRLGLEEDDQAGAPGPAVRHRLTTVNRL